MPQEGKTDMDRIGLFSEMGYISVGDKYAPFYNKSFNESAHKNKQMLSGATKKKSGLQAGYFDADFRRIFEREAYTDALKLRRQYKMQQARRNLGKAFLPSNAEKRPSGVGSYYGTLGGPIEAMSALNVPRKPYKPPGKNILTSPPKKGSGYGFPNVTLSKPEPYTSDPYDRPKEVTKKEMQTHRTMLKSGPFHLNLHPKEYFDQNPYKSDKPLAPVKKADVKKDSSPPFKPSSPGKKSGGMKAGTFDVYPAHSADLYNLRRAVAKEGRVFQPSSGPKSMPFKSIIGVNITRSVNASNYQMLPVVMAH